MAALALISVAMGRLTSLFSDLFFND